jgi:hypothetical protein
MEVEQWRQAPTFPDKVPRGTLPEKSAFFAVFHKMEVKRVL